MSVAVAAGVGRFLAVWHERLWFGSERGLTGCSKGCQYRLSVAV